MFDLEPLSTGENSNFDECLPFEESLSKALKDTHGKTIEELEEQWANEDEEAKEKAEEYIESLKYNSIDFENDDEYSSGEATPTCNPWRE